MEGATRQALVVLGMHRGGTSAVAGTAARLGLIVPRTPLPAADDNPSGLYESVHVVTVNYNLLRVMGCAWNVCLTFDVDRLHGLLSPGDRQFMVETIRQEFGDTGSFVLKDPRLCLTFPVWLAALRSVGAEVRTLIVVRHPGEIVRSLAARNGAPEIEMAPHWLHHMLEAEFATRGMCRSLISYDDLMDDWQGCMQRAGQVANVAWPIPIALAKHDVDAFLAASSRHHAAASDTSAVIGPTAVADLINMAWIALLHLVRSPESAAALACLDHIRSRFADWRREVFPPEYRATFPDG